MQNATSDFYAIGSGGRLRAGLPSVLPPWVPALGTVADVSTNVLVDVRGSSAAAGLFSGWSGISYAPLLGDMGSFICMGGGHGDGSHNDIYRYDIATRVFSKIKNAAPIFIASNTYVADPVTGWMWGDTGATTVQVGEPFCAHFYSFAIVVPRSDSPYGSLLTPTRGSMPLAGQFATQQSHRFNLNGSATKWDMHGAPLTNRAQHGCSIFDSKRRRVVVLGDGPKSVASWTDPENEATGDLQFAGSYDAYYRIGGYHTAEDLYMIVKYLGGLRLTVIDPVTGAVTHPTAVGDTPTEADEGAWDWVERWNSWVYYPGMGGNNIYQLKAPSNPRTDMWTWIKHTVTGTARARQTNQGGPPYNRLRYNHPTQSVFWAPKVDEPVQAFRIPAP